MLSSVIVCANVVHEMTTIDGGNRIVRDWFVRYRTRHGFFGALRLCAADLWEFARESTPARRRARFGDIDFDCDYRVNTTAAGQSWRTRLRALLAGAPYQPTEPALFHEMVRSLQSASQRVPDGPQPRDAAASALDFQFEQFTFLDVGSGKGRALLLASDYPFRKITGIELLPEFHAEALQNITKYRSPAQRCFAIELLCANAREIDFASDPLVIYLFNPLPESDLRKTVARLEDSLRAHPRPVYLIYHNPLLEHVLAGSQLLRKIGGTHQYAIYKFDTRLEA
jgi:hypothetical protein